MAVDSSPTLYLIPSNLAEGDPRFVLPVSTVSVASRLNFFVAENAKAARAFLKAIGHPMPLRDIGIQELNEHTPPDRVPALLAPLNAGDSCGLLAEAGCPAVADPGAPLVLLAHQSGITVKPLVGPSSIMLALMASGLQGQRFAFHGYLPAKKESREDQLKVLEADSRNRNQTQIFIETPYRNLQVFESLTSCCAPETLLCIASDLTGSNERVTTRQVGDWRRRPLPEIGKIPTVFLLYAGRPSAQRRA
jgi:16S rRNA (cytidine1402-2'-O)-methyltransferase